MILTGKAVNFVEDFEEAEKGFENPLPDEEITEDEQITLYMINKMFMKEANFRKAICLFTDSYGNAMCELADHLQGGD